MNTHIGRVSVLLSTLCVVLLSVVGCRSDLQESEMQMIDVPSPPGSGQPHLHATPDGTLWMSWIEPVDPARSSFRFASFDGEAWSEPNTIVSGVHLFENAFDIPRLHPLPGGQFAAHYMVNSESHPLAYDLKIKRSSDGEVWGAPIVPHNDRTDTQHGFASVVPWGSDQLLAVWLDGRETELVTGEYDESEWGEMSLRSAVIGPSGTVTQGMLLDQRVCDCCATSAVRTGDEALVAYRDRSEHETRDIRLLRLDGETWSESYPLHDDGWRIDGCPVNGPALASNGDRVVAAWFTAADDHPRVQAAFSDDEGRTFGPPVVVDADRPNGRVGVVLLDDGAAVVSWMGTSDGNTSIKLARVDEREGAGTASTLVQPQSPAFAGVPQLVAAGSYVFVAWVDGNHADTKSVRLARASIQSFEKDSPARDAPDTLAGAGVLADSLADSLATDVDEDVEFGTSAPDYR